MIRNFGLILILVASLDFDKNDTLSQFDEQALVKQCKWMAMGAESLMIGLKTVETKLKESIYQFFSLVNRSEVKSVQRPIKKFLTANQALSWQH